MIISLASPPFPKSIQDGLYWIEKGIIDSVKEKADIICFPESFIPGYPGMGFQPEERSQEKLQSALEAIRLLAKKYRIAVIIPMDWYEKGCLYNVAHVISKRGEWLGYQTKNQLDPTEDEIWQPGTQRNIFEIEGVKIGITICHEGFRYPESVRWAAQQGASIVFHPHCCGTDRDGVLLTEWGSKNNPYYEKAMMMRAMENTIYFASSNYGFKFPDSASSLIDPEGKCLVHGIYGKQGISVVQIDIDLATGLLAKRFKNDLYSI